MFTICLQIVVFAYCVLMRCELIIYTDSRGDYFMKDNFVVKPKTTRSVTMTIRIDSEINEKLDELALKSNRSRNELINMSLRYAFENLKFIEEKK